MLAQEGESFGQETFSHAQTIRLCHKLTCCSLCQYPHTLRLNPHSLGNTKAFNPSISLALEGSF